MQIWNYDVNKTPHLMKLLEVTVNKKIWELDGAVEHLA